MKKSLFIIALVAFNIQLANAQVGVGTTTPNSTLDVNGSLTTNVEFFSSDTTLDETHHTVVANNLTITLPDPTNIIGREYIIKAGNSGNTRVAPSGTDGIDGSPATIILDSYESIKVKAVGAGNWVLLKDSSSGAKEINDLSDARSDSSNNVYIGEAAGAGATGSQNNGLGQGSLLNSGGDNNIAFGHLAGDALIAGNNNIFLGHSAGAGSTSGLQTGTSNILIGYNVHTSGRNVVEELNIGDALYGTGLYSTNTKIGIGNINNAPNSTLDVDGSVSLPINSGTTAYTLTDNDYTYLTNGADVTLPSAVGIEGRIYIVKNIGATTQRVYAASGETIDNAASASIIISGFIPILPSIKLQSDGANWWIISR